MFDYESLEKKMMEEYEFLYKEIFVFNSYNCEPGELDGRIVIDIGANTGYFSIYAIKNGAKKVYAYEPNRENYIKLVERTKDFDNIIAINKAVHAPNVEKCYLVNDNNPCLSPEENGVRTEVRIPTANEREKGTIDCISLKEIMDGISENVILKTDCEGSEYDFFLPCSKKTLQKIDIIYSEFHDKLHPNPAYNPQMLTDFIVNNGFDKIDCIIRWSTGIWIKDDYVPLSSDKNGDNNYYRKFKRRQEASASDRIETGPESRSKPLIYDCFPFFNELDLLEIRLEELYDVVDKFVITESNTTHSGNPKPLYLKENFKRFEKYKDKIELRIIDLSHVPKKSASEDWAREHIQRNDAVSYLSAVCKDDDIILVSDADEIPRKEAILQFISDDKKSIGILLQDRFMYYLNYKNVTTDEPQSNSRAVRYGLLKRYNLFELNAVRYADKENLMPTYIIPNGGWHFTFMGGFGKVLEKIKAFAHQEYNVPQKIDQQRMLKRFEEGLDVYDAKTTWEVVEVDQTFPKMIREFKQKYVDSGWIKEKAVQKKITEIPLDIQVVNAPPMEEKKDILCSISTKGRYDTTLPLAIMSVVNQTKKPDALIIFDDNDNPKDLRDIELYAYLLRTLDEKGIYWKVIFGQKKGQHYNHQAANKMGYKWVWRIDDDCVAEPNVLETLYSRTDDSVGAVGGSILTPPFQKGLISSGKIENITTEPNIQWDHITKDQEVDHLHCSYLYRANVEDFCLELSRVAHREETLHTLGIKKKGYKVIVVPCITWHYRNRQGGIRSINNDKLYHNDDQVFYRKLDSWNMADQGKLVVLDNGIGDHYAFKHILNKLKIKHQNLTLAVCFPQVFEDDDVKLISIQDAKNLLGPKIDDYNIYKFMGERGWSKTLVEAFETMYQV